MDDISELSPLEISDLNKEASIDALSPEESEFLVFARKLEGEIADKLRTSEGAMITSIALDHMIKFDIVEVERYPIHWTDDMVKSAIANSNWINLGLEMRVITIGQFRSLLVPM